MRGRLSGLVLSLALCGSLAAGDWTGFRGPLGSGIADDADTPLTWSNTENLLWKLPLPGPGSSSPIVLKDRVYVHAYSGYGETRENPGRLEDLKRHLLCVDRANGSVLWTATVPAEMPEDAYNGFITEHGYASSTPVTDGERIYAFFGKSGLCAFDLDGNKLWQKSVGKESSSRRWGSAASPILHGNLVIVNAGEESQSLRAFDKITGEEKWKAEAATLELAYATPIIVLSQEGKLELVISVPNEVWGLNPETGKLLWYAETTTGSPCSPSLVQHDGIVYGMGGRNGGSFAIRTGGSGDVTKTHVLWTTRETSYSTSPVLTEGHLYWVDDRAQAFCLKTDNGSLVYRERITAPGRPAQPANPPAGNRPGRGQQGGLGYYASPTKVGDKLYAVSRRGGTFVIAADPTFKVLAHNQFEGDDTDFNGSPAASNGHLFLRSNKFLYAVGK